MRVLHVIRGLANSSGTTHIVNPLAEAQGRLGAKVRVLHVEKPGAPSIEADSRWVASRQFPMSIPVDNPGVSLALARALPAELAACDVLHVHAIWNFPTWWAMRCAHKSGKPFMVAPQGSFDPWAMRQNFWAKRFYGAITELPLLRRANRMQALTEKEAQQFRLGGLPGRIDIVPNGIAADALEVERQSGRLARQLELPSGSRTLLFLSRVHVKKGLDTLIQAFADLPSEYLNVYLIIAGHDSGSGYTDEMLALANQFGVAGRCRFIGEVAGQAKSDVLSGADAFALISRSEGLPVAALEALGAGLPCVLSTECNLPEVDRAEAGWVVGPNKEETQRALCELFSNSDQARDCGARARKLVARRFTWERIADQTLRIYQEMVSEVAVH